MPSYPEEVFRAAVLAKQQQISRPPPAGAGGGRCILPYCECHFHGRVCDTTQRPCQQCRDENLCFSWWLNIASKTWIQTDTTSAPASITLSKSLPSPSIETGSMQTLETPRPRIDFVVIQRRKESIGKYQSTELRGETPRVLLTIHQIIQYSLNITRDGKRGPLPSGVQICVHVWISFLEFILRGGDFDWNEDYFPNAKAVRSHTNDGEMVPQTLNELIQYISEFVKT
ncbi:hypothetical protein B0J14DRAFT_559034 [Halenospora varia]|nr:hypothetical protein B0J14DRAFT_559034 [Halenospora varia]